jgi:large subunit ribosomal protein L6
MSRIGTKPIPVPAGVTVTLSDRTVQVAGPQGELRFTHRPEVSVRVDARAGVVVVERRDDQRSSRALHGLTRRLIANMVEGCTNGFSKAMELHGVGYGVQVQGQTFTMTCGLSHPVVFELPNGIAVDVQVAQARGGAQPAQFTVRGADKQLVGEMAAQIRRARPPEPYKGKGVRYAGEHVRRKAGKAFAGAGTG